MDLGFSPAAREVFVSEEMNHLERNQWRLLTATIYNVIIQNLSSVELCFIHDIWPFKKCKINGEMCHLVLDK